jgi:hypothetical protein
VIDLPGSADQSLEQTTIPPCEIHLWFSFCDRPQAQEGHERSAATIDRELLLYGSRRNAALHLWEVQRYGIVDFLLQRFSRNCLLCAIQVYEAILPISVIELRARFD